MRDDVLSAANQAAVNGEIACADAHEIAKLLGIEPIEVGKAVNRATNLRFNRCQLGLFGYGIKAENKHKIVIPALSVPPDIETTLRAHTNAANKIPCLDVWDIAAQYKYPRLGMANILEALHIKVAPCQLGCF